MQSFTYPIAAIVTGVAAQALGAPSPLQIASTVMVEHRSVAADGSVLVALAPAKRAMPGDQVVFALDYRNIGNVPLADVVFDNPLPAAIAYRAATPGSPEPQLSVDGKTFGPLSALHVAGRQATGADITHVRWKLAAPVQPGGHGRLAIAAVLK